MGIPLLTIALASSPATPSTKTDDQAREINASPGWHDVETWTLVVTTLAAPLSFKDSLDRLHDAEDTLDDGSDDDQDKWRGIERRIEAIRNLRAIISKRIHRLRRIAMRFAHTFSPFSTLKSSRSSLFLVC